jgi:hypothetical protein
MARFHASRFLVRLLQNAASGKYFGFCPALEQ